MPTTRLPNTGLQYPGLNEAYASMMDENFTILDGLTALGGLAVTIHEDPSTTLNVAVAAGNYRKADGTIGTYAGTASQAITASSTVCLWLTDAAVLTTGASFPSTAHVRLATVVSGLTTITSVTDARVQCMTSGTGAGINYLLGVAYVTIGNDATLTGERALTGTTNQITITDNGANSTVVLATPQNIHTGATPTFAGLTVSTSGITVTAGGLTITAGGETVNGGNVTWANGTNLVLGTGSGTQFGTGTTQKLGFYGTAAIVQPAATSDLGTVLSNLGLRASGTAPGVFSSMTTAFVTKTSAYTAAATDRIIFVDSTSAAVTITLPASVAGKDYIIKDWKGTSATNNITISFTSIDGAATKVISTNYAAVRVIGDGTNYGTV